MPYVYLDHNATTPVNPAVLAAMLPYFSAEFGNASSVHSFGQRARAAIERARESVAALIGAKPAEIVFTSGGTESDNAAIFGVAYGLGSGLSTPSIGGRCHVISTTIEHHAVLHACEELERRGIAVSYVDVGSDGIVDPKSIRRALRPETVLISVMHANNELGTLQPVAEIGRIAAEAKVRFHTDAVQSAGKVPINVGLLGVDLLSLSGHKFGGPQGVGALFVRKGTQLKPLLYGGSNERGRRPGSDNLAGIVGLGKAADLAVRHMAESGTRMATLRDCFERGLLEKISGSRVNGATAMRLPNTSNFLFPGVDSESLVIALDLMGIACSAGAACSAGTVEGSHVLSAIGLSSSEARASVRFSLGDTNTEEEIAYAVGAIAAAVALQCAPVGAAQ